MAIALVSQVVASSAAGNGITSGAIDTTGANLLVMIVSFFFASDPTVQDSKGNTWVGLTTSANGLNKVKIFYVVNPTVGSGHTFTVNGTANFPAVLATAWSGANTSAPFDQQNTANGSGTSVMTGSVTPSENNEVLIAGEVYDSGAAATSVDSSFTLLTGAAATANAEGVSGAYQIQTTATARNATFTHGTSATRAAAIATFKEEAAAAAVFGRGVIIPQAVKRASYL